MASGRTIGADWYRGLTFRAVLSVARLKTLEALDKPAEVFNVHPLLVDVHSAKIEERLSGGGAYFENQVVVTFSNFAVDFVGSD